jgi:hypothetical protein
MITQCQRGVNTEVKCSIHRLQGL